MNLLEEGGISISQIQKMLRCHVPQHMSSEHIFRSQAHSILCPYRTDETRASRKKVHIKDFVSSLFCFNNLKYSDAASSKDLPLEDSLDSLFRIFTNKGKFTLSPTINPVPTCNPEICLLTSLVIPSEDSSICLRSYGFVTFKIKCVLH